MTFWFLPATLTKADEEQACNHEELALAAEGTPDLSKAFDREQLSDWLRKLHTDCVPEQIAAKTEHYWKIANEILPDDFAVVVDAAGSGILVGKVVGAYRYENRIGDAFHVLPVEWQSHKLSLDSSPNFALYMVRTTVSEITQKDVLDRLGALVPSLRRRRLRVVKWVAIIALVSELLYFWPT